MQGRGRTHGNAGHALDTTRNHHVLRSAHHGLRCKLYGLLTGSALPVDRDGRSGLQKSLGSQNSIAPDLHGLLARLADATHDHILHRRRVKARALHDSIKGYRREIDRMHPRQTTPPFAAGRSNGLYNIRLWHNLFPNAVWRPNRLTSATNIYLQSCILQSMCRTERALIGVAPPAYGQFPCAKIVTSITRNWQNCDKSVAGRRFAPPLGSLHPDTSGPKFCWY